jgi:DNA polymerase-3 subunit beta
MQVTFESSDLYEAVHAVSGVVPQRTPRPALQCIHMQTRRGSEVVLSATDLQMAIRRSVKAKKIGTRGEGLIHGTRLAGMLREIPKGEVGISIEEGRGEVRSAKARFRLVTQDPAEFPALVEFGEPAVTVKASELGSMVARTNFATAEEQGRYAIHGIHVRAQGGTLELAATDGRRLAVARVAVPKKAKLGPCIVRTKMLSEIRRLAGEKGDVDLAVDEGRLLARSGDTLVAGTLIEGSFPPYEDMIPAPSPRVLRISAPELASRVRQAALLTTEDRRAIRLDVKKDRVVIEARSAAIGEASIEVEAAYDGDAVAAAFNPQFLLDVLPLFGEEVVGIEITSPESPAVFRTDEFVYVIAPVKIAEGMV